MKQASNVAKLGLVILGVLFMLALTSCKASNKGVTLNKTRQKVERMTNPNRQFIVVNNQIIMFENGVQ